MADLEARLLNRRLIDEQTGCWNWTGYKNRLGYGEMSFEGRKERVHRVAAYLWLGYDFNQPNLWALRQHVLHKCNNPSCFNPEHLYIGDNRDNSRDSKEVGTTRNLTGRILTDDQVNTIRTLLDEGFSHRQIVAMIDFKTNIQTVSKIRRDIYYSDVERS